mgnify:CR=1 FL=1
MMRGAKLSLFIKNYWIFLIRNFGVQRYDNFLKYVKICSDSSDLYLKCLYLNGSPAFLITKWSCRMTKMSIFAGNK